MLEIEYTNTVSGCVPFTIDDVENTTIEERENVMYKLTVKNGDYGYHDGVYGTRDYTYETKDLAEAMRQFLEYVQENDYDEGEKVTLAFKNVKDKKKEKGKK